MLEMELDEVFNSIDDITDPTSMETILMYLDYLQEEDKEYIQLLIDKLPYTEITWEQPWYQKYRSLTRPLTTHDNLKENFRDDKLTEEERKRIYKNWRKLCKDFNIPDKLECFSRWKNTVSSRNPHTPEECVRRFVIAYLAKGLQRNLYQVYKHVVAHYGSLHKGSYSLQEEKVMEVCFYHNARNAIPLLSKVLGRESRGIYKKLKEWLNGKQDIPKMKWTLPLATKLVKLLIEYTGIPLEELKYKQFNKSIWMKLEKAMDHPYIYLQQCWYYKLHVQIFVKKDVKINKIRKKIVRKLQESSYKVWRDIRWKEMLKEFPDGFTEIFLYRACINIFRKDREVLKRPMKEIVEYAILRISQLPNRRLKRLTFNENGELMPIEN